MKQLEQDVEGTVIKIALNQGWTVRKVQWVGRKGAPDRFFAKEGHAPFFIEFKRPGGKLRASQAEEIPKLLDAGVTVHVVDNIEDGAALFGIC
jgi:hypothetical protein